MKMLLRLSAESAGDLSGFRMTQHNPLKDAKAQRISPVFMALCPREKPQLKIKRKVVEKYAM